MKETRISMGMPATIEIVGDGAREGIEVVFEYFTSVDFDSTRPDGRIDPSGIVKGWAIRNTAELLRSLGYSNFSSIGAEGVATLTSGFANYTRV